MGFKYVRGELGHGNFRGDENCVSQELFKPRNVFTPVFVCPTGVPRGINSVRRLAFGSGFPGSFASGFLRVYPLGGLQSCLVRCGAALCFIFT